METNVINRLSGRCGGASSKKTFLSRLLPMLLLSFLILPSNALAQRREIGKVEVPEVGEGWIKVFDTNGEKIGTLPTSEGNAVGAGDTFFILQSKNGKKYYLYDVSCKKYKTLRRAFVGEIISVSKDTFTSRKGKWIFTFDSNGKKITTQPAQ